MYKSNHPVRRQTPGEISQVQPNDSTGSLWEFASIFWRHKGKVLLCFAATMATVVVVTLLMPKQYASEAKLLVRLGRENMGLDPAATFGDTQSINMTQTREAEINSVASLLTNRNLSEKTVDRIGHERILGSGEDEDKSAGGTLDKVQRILSDAKEWLANSSASGLIPSAKLTPREKAIRTFQKNLEVTGIPDTNLVSAKYESIDPKLSQAVVEGLVEIYLDEHVKMYRSHGTHEFLSKQTSEFRDELLEDEERLRVLENETGLISPVEQRVALVKQISNIRKEQISVQSQKAEVSAQLDSLRDKLSQLSKTLVLGETAGVANHASDGMREQLYALQMEEQDILARHTDKSPRVRVIRQQIEAAEKILEKEDDLRTESTTGPNRVYEEAELEMVLKEPVLAALIGKDKALTELLADAKEELQTLNNHEVEVARLSREIEIQDIGYRKYAIDTEQARIDQSLEAARISNISVAQPATFDPYPTSPRIYLNLLLGFIAAVCASIGMAVVTESYQRWKESVSSEGMSNWDQLMTRETSLPPNPSPAPKSLADPVADSMEDSLEDSMADSGPVATVSHPR